VVLGCATAPTAAGASTANGSVRITLPHDAPAYSVRATTDNGRARSDVAGRGADDRRITAATVNGDVSITRR
jgi:DUF4097 and DUF4098 domain-containing protein YvlB